MTTQRGRRKTGAKKAPTTGQKRAANAAKSKAEAAKKREAAKAARERAREAKKQKMESERKAKHEATMRQLSPIAREINTRFEKAATFEGKADDHRLAAALRIAEAKELCTQDKLSFKDWVEANIQEQSYETVRQLARVGAADDPALALEDLRGKNKERNKEHRARAKAGKATGSRDTTPAKRQATGLELAEAALKGLGDKGEVSLIESRAQKHGMAIIPKAESKRLQALTEGYGDPNVAKAAFTALKPSDKMTFLSWAANEVGAKLDVSALTTPPSAKKNGDASDPGELPGFLKRGGAKKTAAKKAPARGRKRASA